MPVPWSFHSKMLEEAGEKLAEELKEIRIHSIEAPYVSNVTADFVTDKSMVKELLQKQISSPVRWQQSVEKQIENGAEEFVEIGPGRTLSSFLKKIDRSKTVYHIEKPEDLDAYVQGHRK